MSSKKTTQRTQTQTPNTRVPSLRRPGLFVRMVARYTRRLLGRVPSALNVYFRHKSVLKGYLGMEWALRGANEIAIELKTLAQIRVATLVGCSF